jgi:asparagine synthase (glutamine-hydrolysing)
MILLMCGIAGLAGRGAPDVPALERMAIAMTHRGPDDQGVWHDGEVGLAFRRLAIIDLDERSNQPLHFGPLHLVFNGEIYNYVELREVLRHLGHHFVTEGDTEVLLHAWAEWGEHALGRLNGMFAFAVWDDLNQSLALVTDRFAEKPLFFRDVGESLMFASDVRALRAADTAAGVPDQGATERFLALGTMPVLPDTFFADVKRLPPAHIATWRPGGAPRMRRWWKPGIVDVPHEPDAAARELNRLLTESIALRLRSDVPVGTSLSGGVDSSAIVAISASLAGDHRRHAFTATFEGFERDEWTYAKAVATTAGVVCHHAVRPSIDELLDDLPKPFGGTSIYAQWRVMRAAREAGVVVLLDGQGADELFGGYLGIEGPALRSIPRSAALRAVIRNRRLARSAGLAYSLGAAPRVLVRQYHLRRASPYVKPDLAQQAVDYTESPSTYTEPAGSPFLRERLRQTFRTSLPDLCRFADKDSMAASVEVRLPFLDPSVAEFALSLPAHVVWDAGLTKRVLRDAIRGLVPEVILDRRDKIGYETPQDRWFATDDGRARVAEIILDGAASETYVRAEVERDLAAGAWRDTSAIWRLVNVELWLAAMRTGAQTL